MSDTASSKSPVVRVRTKLRNARRRHWLPAVAVAAAAGVALVAARDPWPGAAAANRRLVELRQEPALKARSGWKRFSYHEDTGGQGKDALDISPSIVVQWVIAGPSSESHARLVGQQFLRTYRQVYGRSAPPIEPNDFSLYRRATDTTLSLHITEGIIDGGFYAYMSIQ